MTSPLPTTAERFIRYPLTWAVYGMVGYFAYMQTVLGPLMPFLRAEHGFGYTLASLHFSAFASGAILVGISGDRATRLWGRRVSLWGGGAGMALGAALLALGSSAAGTISGTFVMGVSGSLLLITTQAVLADRHGRWSAVALTESNVAASACAIGASLAVGACVAAGLGWRAALALPVAALVVLAIRFRAQPLGRSSTTHLAQDETSPLLSARFWAYSGVLFLGVSVEWCIAYWGADFLENGVGLGRSSAVTALSVFFGAMLAGRILGSLLARRLAGPTLLVGTLCVALAGFILFWLASTPALNLPGLFVTGLGIGSVYPLAISVGVASVPDGADAAAARLALAGGGAILLAPFALGGLADRIGIEAAYGIVVPMLVVAVLLLLLARRLDTDGNT